MTKQWQVTRAALRIQRGAAARAITLPAMPVALLPTYAGQRNILGAKCRIILYTQRRGVAQPGSAPALGAGGLEFKSPRPDHFFKD
jgi:hypothetical protein